MTKEIRAAQAVEIREAGEGVRVTGHAAVYGERARIGDYFEERIARGAFDNVLGDDVPFLIEHQGLPLARTGSGTLKLSLDERGLYVETDLDPSDPDAARIIPKMRRGDLSKMSFAFTVEREEWDESGEIPLRTILAFRKLYDVAIVTTPAYAGTDIGLRGLEAAREAAALAGAPQPFQPARRAALALRARLIA